MQLFEGVLTSGLLRLRIYSKSIAAEVHSHQWGFCHYQELEKRILRHIFFLSSLWVFSGRAKSFNKGFHLQNVEMIEEVMASYVYVCQKLEPFFLQLKQPGNTHKAKEIHPGVGKAPPPPTCTEAHHSAQTLLLTDTWSFKACFLRRTWAMPILVN